MKMEPPNQARDESNEQQAQSLQPSQAPSSHFPLDPITADVLLDREVARRDGLKRRRNLLTGCAELDGEMLLGGFERGCVVGISAEEEEMGLLIGLQTMAHLLVCGEAAAGPRSGETARAMIITTLAANSLMPMLRNVLLTRALALKESSATGGNVDAMLRESLECISISRIFDFDGLCEVLRELDMAASETQPQQPQPQPPSSAAPDPPGMRSNRSPEKAPSQKPRPVEIQDSEDEGGSLSSPTSSSSDAVDPEASTTNANALPGSHSARPPSTFDIILITHMSALLSSLFSRREKASAHALVQLLATQLRYLSRARQHDGPLVLVLNSTSSSSSSSTSLSSAEPYGYGDTMHSLPQWAELQQQKRHDTAAPSGTGKPLDPTLRSIFSPAIPDQGSPLAHRRFNNNKPAFGLVFAQLLDMHLLCTRVPRTRRDAEMLFAAAAEKVIDEEDGAVEEVVAAPRVAWVVEVLLDEIGVWDMTGRGQGGPRRARRSREQRWGAVDVVGGGVVVDAFMPVRKEAAPLRITGGFGGPRV